VLFDFELELESRVPHPSVVEQRRSFRQASLRTNQAIINNPGPNSRSQHEISSSDLPYLPPLPRHRPPSITKTPPHRRGHHINPIPLSINAPSPATPPHLLFRRSSQHIPQLNLESNVPHSQLRDIDTDRLTRVHRNLRIRRPRR
jgi:hypothetical protein